MEIRHRIGLPKMRFHVMNRGARKVDIFAGDEDRSHFVRLLARVTLKHQIRLMAWCLMSNHYHLEAEGEGTPLARMMHDLDGMYATYYNERHDTNGCLFQGRFKAIGIQDDDAMVYVSRYIHANPLAFGVQPENYPWSSCRSYLGESPTPEWLDPARVLELLGPDSSTQRERYRSYLEAVPPPRTKDATETDDRVEFYRDFVRHFRERCLEAINLIGGSLRIVSPKTVVLWIARKKYGIPCSSLSELYDAQGVPTIRRSVFRLGRLMRDDPELAEAVQRVYEAAGRFR